MKKQTILIVAGIVCLTQGAISQVTNPTNTFNTLNEYVGWNTTPGSPDLNIKHELDQPIHFYTNAGAGNKPSFPFLSILQLFISLLKGTNS